jgi:hypothetical protein
MDRSRAPSTPVAAAAEAARARDARGAPPTCPGLRGRGLRRGSARRTRGAAPPRAWRRKGQAPALQPRRRKSRGPLPQSLARPRRSPVPPPRPPRTRALGPRTSRSRAGGSPTPRRPRPAAATWPGERRATAVASRRGEGLGRQPRTPAWPRYSPSQAPESERSWAPGGLETSRQRTARWRQQRGAEGLAPAAQDGSMAEAAVAASRKAARRRTPESMERRIAARPTEAAAAPIATSRTRIEVLKTEWRWAAPTKRCGVEVAGMLPIPTPGPSAKAGPGAERRRDRNGTSTSGPPPGRRCQFTPLARMEVSHDLESRTSAGRTNVVRASAPIPDSSHGSRW